MPAWTTIPGSGNLDLQGGGLIANTSSIAGILSVTSAVNVGGGLVQRVDAGANATLRVAAKGSDFVYVGNPTEIWFAATGPSSGSAAWVQATGELAGVQPGINAVGSATNLSLTWYAKNGGELLFGTLTGPTSSAQWGRITGTNSSVNEWILRSSEAGLPVRFELVGSDTNITFLVMGKGTGGLQVGSGGAASAITRHLSTTVGWDPPNLTTLTQAITSVGVTGAAVGDTVVCGFTQPLSGCQLTGYVSGADTVQAVLFNATAVTLNVASGTLRVDCWQH